MRLDMAEPWKTYKNTGSAQRNSPSGAMNGGSNTQGQSSKPKQGPWFQYGDKFGYMNPKGKIQYGVKGPGDGWKGNFVPQQKWQKASWDQGKSVPAVRATPPSFADADYVAAMAEIEGQFRETQAERLHNLKTMRGQFTDKKKSLDRGRTSAQESTAGGLAERGVADSGMAGRSMTDIQRNYQEMLRDAMRQYGPKAQALEKTMLSLAAQRFREQEAAQGKLSGATTIAKRPSDPVKVNTKKKKGKKNG